MKKIDSIISFAILIIAVFYGYQAIQLPHWGGLIGAAFFPKILALLLIILCVVFITVNTLASAKDTRELRFCEIKPRDCVKPIVVVLMVGGYAYSLFHFGFKIPTFILLTAMMRLYQARDWKKIVIIAIIATVLFDVIFCGIFKVPLEELPFLELPIL